VGRRGGAYRSTDDLRRDPVTYEKIKGLVNDLEAKGGMKDVEKFIADLVDQYI
jgi:hypothetical protein